MADPQAVRAVLERHMQSILDNDVAAYHATTVPELTLYEWYVTPHRIDGLAFHDFMLAEAARPDTPASALDPAGSAGAGKSRDRFDLANYDEQVYGDCAICCYTLLLTRGTGDGVTVRAHNESRVLVHFGSEWKVVHVHKSPAWKAPYEAAG